MSRKTISVIAIVSIALIAASCGSEERGIDIPQVYPGQDDSGSGSGSSQVRDPYRVKCKKTVSTSSWTTYDAYTVNCLKGFTPTADPQTNEYGGWKIEAGNTDGYFRTRKIGNRWWLIDPLGNLFLSKAVAVFSPGGSERQKQNVTDKYKTTSGWAKSEITFLKEQSFNSVGAWSQVDVINKLDVSERIPYCVILSPMGSYNGYLKSSGAESAGYSAAGWEGYPYDFAMVFDTKFDDYVESIISKAANYKTDKYCIGYFIDNEIPWKNYAIDRCLQKWPSSHINHQKAQEWLDARKGKSGCTISDVNDADRKAFIAYCYETYLKKVTTALKKYDPNHLFLGDRFNQWSYELVNEEMFKVAGKYADIISINHYQKWQPDQTVMRNWENWSGKPFFITEFYTKGLDSGLGNTTGAGWVVETQNDRGLFFQNFVIELLKSQACVGWHWFTYMDNDPTNTSSDSSNIDSNKGIVKWDCTRYDSLISHMRELNACTYNLAKYFDK